MYNFSNSRIIVLWGATSGWGAKNEGNMWRTNMRLGPTAISVPALCLYVSSDFSIIFFWRCLRWWKFCNNNGLWAQGGEGGRTTVIDRDATQDWKIKLIQTYFLGAEVHLTSVWLSVLTVSSLNAYCSSEYFFQFCFVWKRNRIEYIYNRFSWSIPRSNCLSSSIHIECKLWDDKLWIKK